MRTWIFATLFCVAASTVFAGVEESSCVAPGQVPEQVLTTINVEASFEFGDLDESVCQKIVDKGVKLCKNQVKAGAKCMEKDIDTVRNIAVKQCKQLDDPVDRENCKAFFNEEQDEVEDIIELDREDGLAECDDDFADGLAENCALGLPPP